MRPSGEKVIFLKDEGQGLMIFSFQLQEFGFVYRDMTKEELTRFKRTRLGKKYVGLDATKLICNI